MDIDIFGLNEKKTYFYEEGEFNLPPMRVSEGTVNAMIRMFDIYQELYNEANSGFFGKSSEPTKEYFAFLLCNSEGETLASAKYEQGIINGLYFPRQLVNTTTYTEIKASDVREASEDILEIYEGKKRVWGWTHCHPFEPKNRRTFSSGTDHKNNERVVKWNAPYQNVARFDKTTVQYENITTTEDRKKGILRLSNESIERVVTIPVKNLSKSALDEILDKGIAEISYEEPRSVAYTYSMIVNGKSTDPKYIKTEAVTWVMSGCSKDSEPISAPFDIPLEVVKLKKGTDYNPSDAELRKIVIERFGLPKKRDVPIPEEPSVVFGRDEFERYCKEFFDHPKVEIHEIDEKTGKKKKGPGFFKKLSRLFGGDDDSDGNTTGSSRSSWGDRPDPDDKYDKKNYWSWNAASTDDKETDAGVNLGKVEGDVPGINLGPAPGGLQELINKKNKK